jgi:hypothetical protein
MIDEQGSKMTMSKQSNYRTNTSNYISHTTHRSTLSMPQIPFADLSRGSTPSTSEHPPTSYGVPTWSTTDSDAISVAYSHDDGSWLYEAGNSPTYMIDNSYAETSTASSPGVPLQLDGAAVHARSATSNPSTPPPSQSDDIRKPVEWHVYTMETGGRRSHSASSLESDAQRHTVSIPPLLPFSLASHKATTIVKPSRTPKLIFSGKKTEKERNQPPRPARLSRAQRADDCDPARPGSGVARRAGHAALRESRSVVSVECPVVVLAGNRAGLDRLL